eukprot:m.142218 g.142218  ORF g.142218 m.142218 type:complete len:53 (-) comp14052_c0_seq1:3215-3373(-)
MPSYSTETMHTEHPCIVVEANKVIVHTTRTSSQNNQYTSASTGKTAKEALES